MQHKSVKPGTGIGKIIGGAVAGAAVTLAAVGLFPRDEKPSGPAAKPDVKSTGGNDETGHTPVGFDLFKTTSWQGVPVDEIRVGYTSTAVSVSGLTLVRDNKGHIRLSGTVESRDSNFEFIVRAETGGMTRDDQREFARSMANDGWRPATEGKVVFFMSAVMKRQGSGEAIEYARNLLQEKGIADYLGRVVMARPNGIRYLDPDYKSTARQDNPKLPPLVLTRDQAAKPDVKSTGDRGGEKPDNRSETAKHLDKIAIEMAMKSAGIEDPEQRFREVRALNAQGLLPPKSK